jgi:hypothetical protein
MKVGKNAQQYAKARKMMPEVMAINRERSGKVPIAGRAPVTANVKKFAKGGKVAHDDERQDRALIKKMITASMPGKAKKMAAGGVAKLRRHSPTPNAPRKGTLVGGIK